MLPASPRLALILLVLTAAAPPLAAQGLSAIDAERFATFLDEDQRIENFRHTERAFPQARIKSPESKFQFGVEPRELNTHYQWRGESRSVDDFLDRTVTTGLLVVKEDAIAGERYFRGNTQESLCTSMSVAKSFISALVGLAVADGLIKSIDDPVTDYVPALKGSGYAGVPIKHILQMSSGIDFSEEYDQPQSDINVLMGELAAGGSVVGYVQKLASERPSGQEFYYASVDTQVLGMLVESVTGKSIAALVEERLWQPLGMECDASWCLDNHQDEIAFAFLNATLRDYAKFGRLYLRKGDWNGKRILPAEWVAESIAPEHEYLKLKDFYAPGWDIGYQYQWWAPAGGEGDFTGIGVWGQYLYVNPSSDTIIVKTSVDPQFDRHDMETIAVFRSIVAHLDGK